MEVGRPFWHALCWEERRRAATRVVRLPTRESHKAKDLFFREETTQHNFACDKIPSSCDARGTFYVATTLNQTIGAWKVASVTYMAPRSGKIERTISNRITQSKKTSSVMRRQHNAISPATKSRPAGDATRGEIERTIPLFLMIAELNFLIG